LDFLKNSALSQYLQALAQTSPALSFDAIASKESAGRQAANRCELASARVRVIL
jgi:hypothetical protein